MTSVRHALDQGKDVFAVPGNVDAENAVGTLALLKDGAKLVTCGAEVMEDYVLRYPDCIDLNPELEERTDRVEKEPERTERQAKGKRPETSLRHLSLPRFILIGCPSDVLFCK